MKNGLIERVTAWLWISPIHLVLRPQKKPRLVVDCRYTNDCLADDIHPLPNMRILQRKRMQFERYTVLDLKWGFHNIPIAQISRDLTGFAVPGMGIFRFNVLPFGLKIAPTKFQQILKEVLHDEITKEEAYLYIDDVAIPANSIPELLRRSKRIIEKLGDNGFCINWDKTSLGYACKCCLGWSSARRVTSVCAATVFFAWFTFFVCCIARKGVA